MKYSLLLSLLSLIAWAAAITALMTFLILFSLIIKTKEKLQ